MSRYQFAPGTPGADQPTEYTHIALPTEAQRAEWAQECGHESVGRLAWPDGTTQHISPRGMETYWSKVGRQELEEWEGEAGL